jgi:hypothetical protein
MKQEIEATTAFLHQYLKNEPKSKEIRRAISKALVKKVKGHWDTQYPMKGNGYRAINFLKGMPLDDILLTIAQTFGIKDIQLLFPSELVLWCDPGEVSYRVGDYGYAIVCYESEKADSGTDIPIAKSKKITFSVPVSAEPESFKTAVYAH